MKKIIYLSACFLLSHLLSAQTTTKLDLRLWDRLNKGIISNENMPLLVRGNMAAVKELTEKLGGIYKYGYNHISSVEIPERKLLEFSESKAVEKIEHTGAQGVFLMDTARIRNNVDSVHNGFAPLLGNLKGRNVVVGIIDGGIYWQHFDFKNPADSTTRIQYIWDQLATGGTPPSPYPYGREWTAAQINNGTCTHAPPLSDAGHGTSVAGIAAGNSFSTYGTVYQNQFTGVAPETDIIAVRVRTASGFTTSVADAVEYIFRKADSLGKPCVINTSVGTYYGSRDALDLASQMIETLLDAHGGRAVVGAAGNAGNTKMHLGYNIPPDSAYTFFKYNNTTKQVYFDLWADTANFNSALFLAACNDTFGTPLRSTEYFNVPLDFNPPQGGYTLVTRYLPNNSKFDTVQIAATLDGERYHVEFLIDPSDVSNLWRLQTSGSGTFDLWASASLISTANMTDSVSPSTYIQDPHYRHPDSLKTMVSSWQNSDKVIAVGNYSNRASYVDRTGATINLTVSPYTEIPGSVVPASSLGPTRDNRMKPDLLATGNYIMATGDANVIATYTTSTTRVRVSVTQKHLRQGGTSASSPIVTGIAALYLEQRPTATHAEIKQALLCSAKQDSFTGVTPNYQSGYGKVDAFAAMARPCISFGSSDTSCINYNPSADIDTGCVPKVYGCTDTGSINYNALANVDDGSCIPKVYGCTDTASINYNSLANVNDGNCVPKVYGCTDTGSINYNALANVNDGSCIPKVYGCTDTASINYNPLANVDDGSCVSKVYGCTDTASINYNSLANVDDGSCIPKVYGVMDTSCINFSSSANTDNGACLAKVYGVTDTACINFNSQANTDNGTCIAKIYGKMDTACVNYNPLANVDSGTCLYSSITPVTNSGVSVRVIPNPFSDQTTFRVEGLIFDQGVIRIYNQLGQLTDEIQLAEGKFDYAYRNHKLAAGVYNYVLLLEGRYLKAGKLIVE